MKRGLSFHVATAIFLAAAFMLSTLPGSICLADHHPVYLGMNYPLTGPYSVEGLDQIRGANLAVDEINAQGGILGRRLVLIGKDSSSDELRTKLNVMELIESGCSMILGGASSAVAKAASEVCRKYDVLFFGTLAYAPELTLEQAHPLFFRECSNSHMTAKIVSSWLNRHHQGKRYFFISADYSWGRSTEVLLRRFTGTTDRSLHPGFFTPLGETDFREELRRAMAHEPDILVLVLFGKDMAHALRQANEIGLKRRCLVVAPSLTLGMAERAGIEAMEGVVGSLSWSWRIPYLFDYPEGKRFVESFVKRFHRYPSSAAASAYSVIVEYRAAVERAQSLSPCKVAKALENRRYALLKGEQVWRGLDHQSVQRLYLVQGASRQEVLAETLHLDFFKILLSMPGEELVRTEAEWRKSRIDLGLPPELDWDGACGRRPE